MKVSKTRIDKLARILAYEYADGWKTHQRWIGEPIGMDASSWADANWKLFIGKAELALGVKKKAYFIDALVTASVYTCSPTKEVPSVKFVLPEGQIINESRRI